MAVNTFLIQGITYTTPKVPYAFEIAGTSLNKREQMWIRPTDIPQGEEISDAIFEREWDRIINGYWFMCFGKPTFITGYHYFFLTYYELENGERPDYRRTNRDFFYFWDYLEKKTKALGCIFVKFRREGASSRGASMMLNIGITETRARCGVISKTGTDAEDFFGDMVSTPFQTIPDWLKPIQSGNTKSKKELDFSKPATRIGKSGKVANSGGGFNNRLMMRDTALNSFDSGRLRFLCVDEGGKFPKKVPIHPYWETVRKVLTQGGVRKGMCYMMSTVNEMEKGGGASFKTVWNMSSHIDRSGNEVVPTSGLYRFFIPAYDGYLGYIDKYGESIIEDPTDPEVKKWLQHLYDIGQCPDPKVGAKNYILNKRKALEAQLAREEITEDVLHEEIRTEPFTIKEAFLEPAKDCVVPLALLNKQVDWLDENNDYITGIKRKFNFYEQKDGTVIKIEEAKGRWSGIWDFPNPELQANRFSIDRFGKRMPINTVEFSVGLDPFAHNITVGSKGSNAGGYARRKYVITDPDNSDLPIMQYYYRPKLKSILWNDFRLCCKYLSCRLACEDIMDEFATHFNDHDMEHFYVWTPESMMGVRSKTKKPGIPMNTNKAIEAHTGAVVEDFIHNYHKIYWRELLEQIRHFDPNDRTAFDLVMGHGYSLIGAKDEIRNVIPAERAEKLIATYDLSRYR